MVEGEKCSVAGNQIGLTCVTSSHGSGSAHRTDWTPISGKLVIVIIDADASGEKYGQKVAAILHRLGCKIRIIRLSKPNADTPEGYDIADWIEDHDGRSPDDLHDEILTLAESAPEWKPSNPAGEEIVTFSGLKIGDLIDRCPELRPVMIEGLLRRGETMNVISAPKIGKSWLVIYLALCLVTGRDWLGYPVTRCKVLILDNELHPETIARRIHAVTSSMDLSREDYADRLIVETFRGKLRDWYQLRPYFASVPPGEFGVVICDAFYRFMPKGSDENDNGTMAGVFNQIDAYADMIGSSFVLIHHSTKGVQAGKAVTDVGAGAGAQSRATDTHLILRHHQEQDVAVLEAAVRSFKPVEPACIRWEYPRWYPAPQFDPEDLRQVSCGRKKSDPPPEVAEEPKPEPWTVQRFVEHFVTAKPQGKASIMAHAEGLGVSLRKAETLFRAGIEMGQIHEWAHPTDRRIKTYANAAQTLTDLTPQEAA